MVLSPVKRLVPSMLVPSVLLPSVLRDLECPKKTKRERDPDDEVLTIDHSPVVARENTALL
jgi:hypothetical protein